MKVHVTPPHTMSQAMFRVERALRAYAPSSLEFVDKISDAELVVQHVIGPDTLQATKPANYAVIQYCYQTAGGTEPEWKAHWRSARAVWSYYDLPTSNLYRAPLGVDGSVFFPQVLKKDITVMTSGYVHGLGAEAIEEPALAARAVGGRAMHLGPQTVQNMKRYPKGWLQVTGVTDEQLCVLYNHAGYVSGLRHVEGFELPALEGLACGRRPILFDRPEMRNWYNGHAVFVPECSGEELVERLTNIFLQDPTPVTDDERACVLDRFSWEAITRGFWKAVLSA